MRSDNEPGFASPSQRRSPLAAPYAAIGHPWRRWQHRPPPEPDLDECTTCYRRDKRPKGKGGLRDRISLYCTLSQNGYGDR